MKRFAWFAAAALLMAGLSPASADTSIAGKDVTGQTIETTGDVIVEITGRHNVTVELATGKAPRSVEVCFASRNGNYGRPGSTCKLKGHRTSWARDPSSVRWRMP